MISPSLPQSKNALSWYKIVVQSRTGPKMLGIEFCLANLSRNCVSYAHMYFRSAFACGREQPCTEGRWQYIRCAINCGTNSDRARHEAARAIPNHVTAGRKAYQTPTTRSEAALHFKFQKTKQKFSLPATNQS